MKAAARNVVAGSIDIAATAGRDVNISDVTLIQRGEIVQHIAAVYNIQQAADGSAPITASLKDRFRRLLGERHLLFGGREAELERLDSFLLQHSNGYFFLTSRSGFGKTALLANWVKALLERDERVCYHFISRTDGSDVAGADFSLRNLCQQLVAYHKLTGQLPVTTDVMRSLYPELLRIPPALGQRLIVVVDGLDEALDWTFGPDLFPHPLPAGVFVVFSAREIAGRNWLATLELPATDIEVEELQTLGTLEIARLLQAVGANASYWADDPPRLRAVWEISGGDPFYLRYLVEDIRDIPITSVEQLERHTYVPGATKGQRGLKAYLDKWWDEVSKVAGEPAVYNLLGYLLVSKAPLTRDELIQISDEDALNGAVFEKVIQQTGRYVLGDEKEGYQFCHSRFRDYIAQQRIKEPEQEPYRKALLDYCRRWPQHKSQYALAHYTEHLRAAGQLDNLCALLDDPGWYEVQMEADPSWGAFRSDVRRTWALCQDGNLEATRNGKIAPQLGREVRCALFNASLNNNVQAQIPAALLRSLLENRVWSASMALAVVRQCGDSELTSNALATLVPHLPQSTLHEALAIARALTNKLFRVSSLAKIAPYLPAVQQQNALEEALKAAQTMEDADDRGMTLVELLPYLNGSLKDDALQEALKAARTMEDANARGATLVALLTHFSGTLKDNVQREALTAMQEMIVNVQTGRVSGSEDELAQTLALLAPHLPVEQKRQFMLEVLAIARAVEDPCGRAIALAALIPHLATPLQAAVRDEALAGLQEGLHAMRRAQSVRIGQSWAQAFRVLLPQIPDRDKEAVIQRVRLAACEMEGPDDRMEAWWVLLPYLVTPEKENVLQQLRTFASSLEDGEIRTHALNMLLPHLTSSNNTAVLQEALAAARTIGDTHDRIATQVALAHHLLAESAITVGRDALAAAKAIGSSTSRAEALSVVALSLIDVGDLEAALEATRALGRERECNSLWWTINPELYARTLTALASHLPEPDKENTLKDALTAVLAMTLNPTWDEDLAALAPLLSPAMLDEAVAAAQAVEDVNARVLGVAVLLPYVSGPQKDDLSHQALEDILSSDDGWPWVRALTALVPHLSPPLLDAALATARAIGNVDDRALALAGLAPHMPASQKDELVREALTYVRTIDWKLTRAMTLATLAVCLPSSLLDEALAEARMIDDRECRAQALVALAPRLPAPLRDDVAQEALTTLNEQLALTQAGRSLPNEFGIGRELVALVPHLPVGLLSEALETACVISGGEHRAQVLAVLARRLVDLPLSDLYLLWCTTLNKLATRTRQELLSDLKALSHVVLKLGGVEAVTESCAAIQDVGLRWP